MVGIDDLPQLNFYDRKVCLIILVCGLSLRFDFLDVDADDLEFSIQLFDRLTVFVPYAGNFLG